MKNYTWIAGEVLTYTDRRKEAVKEVVARISFVFLLAAILTLGVIL